MNTAQGEWVSAGSGMATSFEGPVEARLREVYGPDDVFAIMNSFDSEDWEAPIILVNEAGGTTLGPLLGEIRGVISTKGTLGAHIALLAKEYGCPCLVGVRLTMAPAEIHSVRIDSDGLVWARTGE